MPTASGSIKADGGPNFTAAFVIDGARYHFKGSFHPLVPEVTSDEAVLTYESVGQLATAKSFNGQVGVDSLALAIENGPRIRGPLNMPISPASHVSGTGTWAQN